MRSILLFTLVAAAAAFDHQNNTRRNSEATIITSSNEGLLRRMEAEINRLKDRVGRLETRLLSTDCKTTAPPSSIRSSNKKQQHHNVTLTNQQQEKLQLERILSPIQRKTSNKSDDDEGREMVGDDPNASPPGRGSGNSWAKLQISPENIGSMPYDNKRLKIYEHAANPHNKDALNKTRSSGKYFYAPISFLDHKSARSSYNNVTKNFEMEFRVEIWNDDVEAKVVDWIKANHDPQVNENFVQVIPFEKMVLATTSPSFQRHYTLPKDWKDYQSEKTVWFKLTCISHQHCKQLTNEMHQNANQFSDFQILFSLASQSSQTKQTVIHIENILQGNMASKLNQRMPPGTEFALVTAEDEQQLLQESATNILIDTFDDSTDVVSSNSEAQIYKFLEDLLISSRETIAKQSDSRMWDSVFWNDDNYRPDRTSKMLNDLYKKQDNETQKKMVVAIEQAQKKSSAKENEKGPDIFIASNSKDEQNRDAVTFDNSTSHGASVGAGFGGFSVNAAINKEQKKSGGNEKDNKTGISSSNSTTSGGQRNTQAGNKEVSIATSLTQEQLDKLIEESKKNVEWDGEKFTPKQLFLTKINLAKLRDAQTFRDRSVRVRYSTAVLSVAINIPVTVNIPDDVVLQLTKKFNEIRTQLEGLKAQLNDQSSTCNNKLIDLQTQSDDLKARLSNENSAVQKRLNEFESKTADQFNGLQIRSEEWKADGGVIWADDCHFRGQDIPKTPTKNTKKEDCGKLCLDNPECDHFTWNNDGECWLKKWSGKGPSAVNSNEKNFRCGFIPSRATADARALGATVSGLVATAAQSQSYLKEEPYPTLHPAQENVCYSDTFVSKKLNIFGAGCKFVVQKRLNDLSSQLDELRPPKPVQGPIPTSCAVYNSMGWRQSGLFLIRSADKIKTVYCDFSKAKGTAGYETAIGFLDVKTHSSGVSFYVQRNGFYSSTGTVIPYEVTRLNVGGHMNAATGVFTTPVNGRYYFSFTAHSLNSGNHCVYLRVNGAAIATSETSSAYDNLPLVATLQLIKGDRVDVVLGEGSIYGGSIFDGVNHYTQFSGFLLEEDLVL